VPFTAPPRTPRLMREGSTRPAGEPGRGRLHRAQLHPSDARGPLAHRPAPIRVWWRWTWAVGGLRWRRAWGRWWAPVAPGVGSGGTGRGAELHPVEVPYEVPYEVPSPLRVCDGSAAPCPAPRTLDPPARMGPWLPDCTLANHCSCFAPRLDTRRCAVSLLLWVVLGRLASL
jgi:hypothetical protein